MFAASANWYCWILKLHSCRCVELLILLPHWSCWSSRWECDLDKEWGSWQDIPFPCHAVENSLSERTFKGTHYFYHKLPFHGCAYFRANEQLPGNMYFSLPTQRSKGKVTDSIRTNGFGRSTKGLFVPVDSELNMAPCHMLHIISGKAGSIYFNKEDKHG